MLHKRLKFILILLFGLLLSGVQAQEVHQAITASGGEASGSGGSAKYSVGQILHTADNDAFSSVIQGIQVPFEIYVVTGIEEAIQLSMSVYPNPTTSHLILKVDDLNAGNLAYKLFDMSGKLLEFEKILDFETTINMKGLRPAMYFIKVEEGNKEIKNFKIVKN